MQGLLQSFVENVFLIFDKMNLKYCQTFSRILGMHIFLYINNFECEEYEKLDV